MSIYSPVRSKCCEAPVRVGHKKIKGQRVQIWVCVNCKKRDVDLVEFRDGKIVKTTKFADDVDTDEPPMLE